MMSILLHLLLGPKIHQFHHQPATLTSLRAFPCCAHACMQVVHGIGLRCVLALGLSQKLLLGGLVRLRLIEAHGVTSVDQQISNA